MKIALVASQSSPPRPRDAAGRGQRVSYLAEALAQLGHHVTIYAPEDSAGLPRRTRAAVVAVEHLPAGARGRPLRDGAAMDVGAFSDHLTQRWRQDPPDVAHAHFWTTGLAAMAGARGLDVPVVQTFDSLGSLSARGTTDDPQRDPGHERARVRLEICLARQANAVLATSSEQMLMLAGMGVPRASIRVVPWGVDTGLFAPEGPTAKRNGRPRLLAVRRPDADQELSIVIRALAEVPAAELLIAGGPSGSGPGADPANQGLARLARDLGVADRITFTGDVSRTHLPPLLRSADVLLSGAWEDPFGTVALQAMACGTPVAASAAGAVGDAVIDGTTGILVPPGKPSLLARRVRHLLASPMQLDAFSIAAVDRARSRYSWDRIGRETVRAYERCLPRQLPVVEDEPEHEYADLAMEA
jgi:D-inositol-3-phosphate glycosyltransferase